MNPLVAPEAGTVGASHGGTALSVNVNRVALLRNTRPLDIPNVLHIASLALQAGADGITVHPRPDERHIRERDVRDLHALLRGWPQAEFNIEGNPFHNLMPLVRECRPAQCTLVPDEASQATSDHGWDLRADANRLRPLIAELKSQGVRVSLFMDPLPEAMAAARELGADRVELYTESYARAHGTAAQDQRLQAYAEAARAALAVGLGVNAGHDLNRANLGEFLRGVPGVREVSIGHALIADAVELGIGETVREYQRVIRRAHAPERGRAMIYGIGNDIVDMRRIQATLSRRGDRFAEKVLGADELKVFHARRARVPQRGLSYLATRFSAKEAFSKAIGLGMHLPMTWRACQILNAAGGKPAIHLHGALAEWFAQRRLQAFVSVSDESDYATAFVVVQHQESAP